MNMQKNNRRSFYFVTITLLAVCLILAIIFSNNFKVKINQYLHANVVTMLHEANNNSIIFVKGELTNEFQILEAIARQISDLPYLNQNTVQSKKGMQEFLSKMILTTKFDRIGVAGLAGSSINNDGQVIDISERGNFLDALNGKNSISQPVNSALDGRKIIILSVPIIKDHAVKGVLSGSFNMNFLNSILQSNSFNGEGYSIIIDSRGSIITQNKENQQDFKFKTASNIFEIFNKVKFSNGFTVEKMKQDLITGQSDHIDYNFLGEDGTFYDRLVMYNPIGYNDWLMMTILPKSVVSSQSQQIMNNTSMLFFQIMLIFIMILGYIIYSFRRNKQEILKAYKNQENIQRTIPGGLQKCLQDDGFTIKYANEGFYDLIGYSPKEVEDIFHNRYAEMILPEDRKLLNIKLQSEFLANNIGCFEYRIRRKDGNILWIYDKMQVTTDADGEAIYICVLLDVTANKEKQEQLRISEERMRIIFNQSDEIIFEYNIADDVVSFSDNFNNVFMQDPRLGNYQAGGVEKEAIYIEDEAAFKNFEQEIRRCKETNETNETEIRIMHKGGVYYWYKITATTLFSTNGTPAMIIGKLTNIDLQKRETEELKAKVSLDPLTKIYNKAVTKIAIEEFLDGADAQALHAFMILDIDNFKGINDNLGHAFGDVVLTEVTQKIKKISSPDDIVGRIGGDEFVVFLKNIQGINEVKQKAETICELFRLTSLGVENKFTVSCSIGIAISGLHGTNFDSLFEKADSALYRAKNHGKDKYLIYDENLDIAFDKSYFLLDQDN